jgi:hypothetical protein
MQKGFKLAPETFYGRLRAIARAQTSCQYLLTDLIVEQTRGVVKTIVVDSIDGVYIIVHRIDISFHPGIKTFDVVGHIVRVYRGGIHAVAGVRPALRYRKSVSAFALFFANAIFGALCLNSKLTAVAAMRDTLSRRTLGICLAAEISCQGSDQQHSD